MAENGGSNGSELGLADKKKVMKNNIKSGYYYFFRYLSNCVKKLVNSFFY